MISKVFKQDTGQYNPLNQINSSRPTRQSLFIRALLYSPSMMRSFYQGTIMNPRERMISPEFINWL